MTRISLLIALAIVSPAFAAEPQIDQRAASKQYLDLRKADHKQGNLSHRQFTSFRCELRAMEVVFRGKTVAELTAAALTDFFRRGQASKKTYNNRRGLPPLSRASSPMSSDSA